MRIVIPGGSGQVGTLLAREFHKRGDEMVILSRTPQAAPWRVVQWDAEMLEDWAAEFEGAGSDSVTLSGVAGNARTHVFS